MKVIVVDAGSVDGTREVALRHGTILLDEPPSKVKGSRRAVACNEGLRHCMGEMVAFLDSDTVAPSTWSRDMETRLTSLGLGVAGITSGCIEDSSTKLSRDIGRIFRLFSSHSKRFTSVTAVESSPGYNSVYWRNVIIDVGGFNEEIGGCEDWEMNKRIRDTGYTLFGVPESPVRHRENPSLQTFRRQVYGYGWSRGRLLKITRIFTVKHLLPSLILPVTYLAYKVLGNNAYISFFYQWGIGYIRGLLESTKTR